jgi:hypothetical protein
MLGALFLTTAAQAAPLTFTFLNGTAQITATAGATLIASTTVSLNGAFVDFDPATPEVIDFSITMGQSPVIPNVNPYGGFDEFRIEFADIVPGVAFANQFISPTGPNTWNFLVGPVDVSGNYSASDSTGTNPSVMNIPAPFVGASFLNGSIDSDLIMFELLGITLTELAGAAFGEADDLIVKADITWVGQIPEPSSGLLLAAGLAMLGSRKRHTYR